MELDEGSKANEAEFEHEASKMMRNMGLQDVEKLKFFQSCTDGDEKWKEGLRKPSQPRVRRFRAAVVPFNVVDRYDERKQAPVINSACRKPTGGSQPANNSKLTPTDDGYWRKSRERLARTQSAPERNPNKLGLSSSTKSCAQRGNSLSPSPAESLYAPNTSRMTQAVISKPATIVKVRSTHIPQPVTRPAPVPVQKLANTTRPTSSSPKAVGATNPLLGSSAVPTNPRPTVTSPRSVNDTKSNSGTEVLHRSGLKLPSFKTCTSTTTQATADSSLPKMSKNLPVTFRHSPAPQQKYTSSGIPKIKQSSPSKETAAYDRLESYRSVVLSSSEPRKNVNGNHSSTPGVSSIHISSDDHHGSNKSTTRSLTKPQRLLAPSSSNGLVSPNHTSRSTTGVTHMRKNAFCFAAKDEGSKEYINVHSLNNNDNEPEPTPNHHINPLVVNSVQVLDTLTEAATPTVTAREEQDSDDKVRCSVDYKGQVRSLQSESEEGDVGPVDLNKHSPNEASPLTLSHIVTLEKRTRTENEAKQPLFQVSLSSNTKLHFLNEDRQVKENLEEEDDFFGYCHHCGKGVVGEDTGCLALGRVFHTACLNCYKCGKVLAGKTFFIIENNIFCETDYFNTLQRCCFCNQRIKEKVLSAFGEVYHPGCFRCTACGLCLDGVPYAGDSYDKVYCIEDYHRLFAPLCVACGEPIVPQSGKVKNIRVKVKNMYYHIRCYKCEQCGKLFASTKQQSIMVDGHLFCQKCHKQHSVRTTIL